MRVTFFRVKYLMESVTEFPTRFVAFLLLGFAAMAFVGAHFCLPQTPPQSAASEPCSGHHPGTPSPAPASHQCCVVSQSAAILPSAFRIVAADVRSSSLTGDALIPLVRDIVSPAFFILPRPIPLSRVPLRV